MNAEQLIKIINDKPASMLFGNSNNYYDGIVIRKIDDSDCVVFQHGGYSDGSLSVLLALNMLNTLPENSKVWYENSDNTIFPVDSLGEYKDTETGKSYIRFDTFLEEDSEDEE